MRLREPATLLARDAASPRNGAVSRVVLFPIIRERLDA